MPARDGTDERIDVFRLDDAGNWKNTPAASGTCLSTADRRSDPLLRAAGRVIVVDNF